MNFTGLESNHEWRIRESLVTSSGDNPIKYLQIHPFLFSNLFHFSSNKNDFIPVSLALGSRVFTFGNAWTQPSYMLIFLSLSWIALNLSLHDSSFPPACFWMTTSLKTETVSLEAFSFISGLREIQAVLINPSLKSRLVHKNQQNNTTYTHALLAT